MILNRKILTSTSLLLLSVVFVATMVLSNQLLSGIRLDLTEQSLYTLSKGTRNILKNLDEPIHLTLYFSNQATADSNRSEIRALRLYFERVRELLEEMNSIANGKLKLEVVDPIAYSESEDKAAAAGIQALPIGSSGEKVFFGLVGSNATDGQVNIAFFDPNKESFLEYDIAKLIHDLTVTKKPKVGLLTSLNMAYGFDQQTMQMTEGWATYQQLTQIFDVKSLVAANLKAIDNDINVLVLVHPKQLNEDAQYAIDQFVLRGGHLLVFVDPIAEQDRLPSQPGSDANVPDRSSNLAELFKAWGVEYNPGQLVLDRGHGMEVSLKPDAIPSRNPAILRFTKSDLANDDSVTRNLDSLILSTCGYFKQSKDSAYQFQPLLQTGKEAMLENVEQVDSPASAEQFLNSYTEGGESLSIAARVTGKFKTAFPTRNEAGHIAESTTTGDIVLVADTDLLSNRLWVRVQNFYGQKVMSNFADNGDWLLNMVDNLSGSSDLLSIRGRGVAYRPFTRCYVSRYLREYVPPYSR